MGSDLISARAQGRRREKVLSAPWAGGLLRRKVNTVWGQRAVPFPHKSPRWRERPVKAPSAFHRIPSHQKTPNPAREAPQLFRPRWTLCHPAGLFCRSCVLGNSGKGILPPGPFSWDVCPLMLFQMSRRLRKGSLEPIPQPGWVRRRVCSACPSALIPVALLTLRAQGEQVRLRPAQEAGLLLLGPLTATNPSGTLQLDLSGGRVQLGVRG